MKHRILSFDGGGAWAMLEAMALKEVFGDIPGRQILQKFDLAVANSGGSIVLGGLIENKSPSEIIQLFSLQANRASIFAKPDAMENLLSHIPIFPKYSMLGKLTGLTKIFGDMGGKPMSTLSGPKWIKGPSGADVKILIVAFDYDSMRAQFFRSYPTAHGATADTIALVQAVHASTNAPVVFFDAPTEWGGRRFWDGAMAGLNNPLMAAVIDLLGESVPAEGITALSIGTGTVKLAPPGLVPAPDPKLAEPQGKRSTLGDLEKATGCITDDPPDMATFSAHVLLQSARSAEPTEVGPVVRLSPIVGPVLSNGAWSVPEHLTLTQFQALTELGMDAVEQSQADLIAALGESWLADGARNQPIRMSSDDFLGSLGEEKFSNAKERWLELMATP